MLKLAKLKIFVETRFGPENRIEVLYNPNRITIHQSGWQTDSWGSLVPSKQPASLNLDLFLDTSLSDAFPSLVDTAIAATYLTGLPLGLPKISRAKDVREHVQKIAALTKEDGALLSKEARPPICRLEWGQQLNLSTKAGDSLFRGFLKDLTTTYTRFLEDGTPVRAVLNCSFEEWKDSETRKKEENPVDDPTRIVKRGETLSSIAVEEYNDPALWRAIALANRIIDPRRLKPGQAIMVPSLQAAQALVRRSG